MSDSNDNFIFKIGLAVGVYFAVVKPVLEKIGLQKSADDIATEAAIQVVNTAAPKLNPFSPDYWKSGPTGTKILTVAGGNALAQGVRDAIGVTGDDESAIYAVFRSFTTKSQVSSLAYYFKQKFNNDLWEFIKGGYSSLPWSGLNSSQLKVVLDIVNKLPNYK